VLAPEQGFFNKIGRKAVIANAMADVGVRAKANPRRGGFKGTGLTTRLPVAFTFTRCVRAPRKSACRRFAARRPTYMGTVTGRSSAVVGVV
jgi:hypothetical protein